MSVARNPMVLSLVLVVALLPGLRFPVMVQGPAVGARPSLSGTWTPVDPDASDQFFQVGLSVISAGTKVTIDQQPIRIAVTITLPDDKLDILLQVLGQGRFYGTVTYRPPDGRSGGYGARGAPEISTPMWFGDRFVPNALPSARPVTMAYYRKGDFLEVESAVHIPTGRVNTATQELKWVPSRP